MRFQCPFCRGIVAVDNSDLGIDVQCGHCGEVVTVPYSRVATGSLVGDFIILEEIGRGGMGIVYLAHQISLDRPAAVKILSDNYAMNTEFIAGFIKEARAAAKLNHPHIVQAYAVGEDEGIYFFAMENIDGETMKNVLKREKVIPVEDAITIIQQIAEALDYAWKEQKLIHRDIKPDNIMMTKNGRAKLADLGLSRVAGDIDDAEEDEVMGTPQYISPEHLTGAPMDVRSDIYSLGATFYHLVTGKFPFEGRTATEIARKHLEEKLVPPHLKNPDIPETVSQIIVKMMEKNNKNRYQNANELVDDLRLARRGKIPSTATGGISNTSGKATNVGMQPVKKSSGGTQLSLGKKNKQMKLPSKEAPTETATQTATSIGTATGTAPKLTQTGTHIGTKTHSSTATGTGFKRETPGMKKPLIIAAIAVILLLGGGGFAYWKLMMAPQTPEQPQDQTPEENSGENTKTPENTAQAPGESDYVQKLNSIITEYGKTGSSRDLLTAADEFFTTYPDPITPEEWLKLNGFLSIYVSLDEERVQPQREEKRAEYEKVVAGKKEEEAKRLAEEKRLADLEKRKQAREADRLKEEEERKQKLAERIQEYKEKIALLKNSMRRRYLIYFNSGNIEETKEVFEPALKESEKVRDFSSEEIQIAKDFERWAEKMIYAAGIAYETKKLLSDDEGKLKGKQFEVGSGELGEIIFIKDGQMNVQLLTKDSRKTIPVTSLPPNSFTVLLKRIGDIVGDANAAFYYYYFSGMFNKALYSAPEDWKKETLETAYSNFLFMLKDASKEQKKELIRKYGRNPAFRKAWKTAGGSH